MITRRSTFATLFALAVCAASSAPASAQDTVFVEAQVEAQDAPPPTAYQQPQPAPYQPQPAQPQQQAAPTVYAQPAYSASPELELRRPNTVYVEGFGGGLWWSLNYERLVLEDLAIRVGFGYLSVEGYDSSGSNVSVGFFSIPISISYLGLGSSRHIFEIGAGLTVAGFTGSVRSGLSTSTGAGATAFGQAFAGYRYHPTGHAGFNFRAGVVALVGQGLSFSSSDPDSIGVLPWPYVSGGLSF